jgi:thiol-disulfide isomerase/thioredoxin
MLDGKYAKLHDFLKDGPMIIDFWATWCEPCKKQMYHLNKFHKHFKDTGFKVLTINTDTPKSMGKVKSYVRSKKFEFMVAVDPNNQVMKKLRVKLMPTTILVDKDGNILYRHQGYLPGDEVNILSHITEHFDKVGISYNELDLGQSKDKQKKDKIDVEF